MAQLVKYNIVIIILFVSHNFVSFRGSNPPSVSMTYNVTNNATKMLLVTTLH